MKSKTIRFIIAQFCFFLFSSFLFCQETISGPISKITIDGLRRTKPHAAERLLSHWIGTPADRLDKEEVIAVLMDTGLFFDVEVAVKVLSGNSGTGDSGAELSIRLREKRALLPMPVVMWSSDGFMGGAVLIDRNAFGILDTLVLGVLYLGDGWQVMTAYNKKNIAASSFGLSISGFYSSRNAKEVSPANETLRVYGQNSINAGISGNYSFKRLLELPLEIQAGFYFLEKSSEESQSGQNAPASARGLKMQAALSLQDSHWDEVFTSRRRLSLAYAFTLGLVNSSFHSVSLSGLWEQSLIPGLKASLTFGGEYAPGAPEIYQSAPAMGGVNILPTKMRVTSMAGLTAGLEVRLVKLPFGLISLSAAYQAAWTDSRRSGYRFDHGPGASLGLYIAQLAFPAIKLGAAYNAVTQKVRFTVGGDIQM